MYAEAQGDRVGVVLANGTTAEQLTPEEATVLSRQLLAARRAAMWVDARFATPLRGGKKHLVEISSGHPRAKTLCGLRLAKDEQIDPLPWEYHPWWAAQDRCAKCDASYAR